MIVIALMLAIEMSRCDEGNISGGAGSGGGSDSMSEFIRIHYALLRKENREIKNENL